MAQEVKPYRFSEAVFRFYEPFIARALAVYPSSIVIDPRRVDRSPETFSCRFRDAVRSFRENRWFPTEINTTAFDEHADELKVHITNDGTCMIGPLAALAGKRAVPNTTDAYVESTTSPTCFTLADQSQIALIGALVHHRMLAHPVLVAGLTDEDVKNLESAFDLAVVKNPDGSFTLI